MNTKHKALLRTCTAFLCAFAICSIHIITFADDSVDKLEQQTDHLQQQLNDLNDQLNNLSTKITDLVSEINKTNSHIEKAELDLVAARLNEQIQHDAMKTRIKFIYESGDTSLLHVLFSADSMTDFLNRAEFIRDITEYDRKMLRKFQDAQETIELRENELVMQQKELETLSDKLKSDQSSLNNLIAGKSQELNLSQDALNKAIEAQNAKPAPPPQPVRPTPKPDTPSPDNSKPAPDNRPAPPSATEDLVLFAAILQCEAGSTNYDALLAVATVIMNRLESSRYPNTLHGVIYQRGQFSPTWNGSLNRVLAKGPASLCYRVAQDALNGARHAAVADCYQFRASYTGHAGIVIGGNVFF